MTQTLTVEGDLATVDALTRITTQGSVTAPSLLVPSGKSRITKIIANCASDGAAAGSAVFFLRLGGSGVRNGEQTIMLSAAGIIAVQTGSDQNYQLMSSFILEDADIEVQAGNNVGISAEMAGSDLGTAGVSVTLVFA